MKKRILVVPMIAALISCGHQSEYASYDDYPTFEQEWLEMNYSPKRTEFMLWAPTAEAVRVQLYAEGIGGEPVGTVDMKRGKNGCWKATVKEDLKGRFYTFSIMTDGAWQQESPGVMAKAVGVNGKRAAIVDWTETHPEGWELDKRPALASFADIVLYEMHHRDFSASASSGITHRGKYLALTEEGTTNEYGQPTGIDHLKELGVTHVHLLPSYDYASVDETRLDEPQYNWGYDPQNYNVPDGSYSTDPYNPTVRIKEFKQMVQALHKAGIRVIMDVVYNHTFNTDDSNFELSIS